MPALTVAQSAFASLRFWLADYRLAKGVSNLAASLMQRKSV